MDFLDSLDCKTHTHNKKTDRMRSWYLYEQYQMLEQNQLDAAQILRNRSEQERFLHQELTERRARRSLYDQVSVYSSEPKLNCSQGTCLSTSTGDFYESFCELHDLEADKDSLDNSYHGSNTCMEDFKALEDFGEDTSCADSVYSVVDKEVPKAANKHPQQNIAENIKMHLQTVTENMVSLGRYAQISDAEHTSGASVDSLGWPKPKNVLQKHVDDNQLFYMWTKLVTFAYNSIQLNHGNCYYDYSSQLLTAVLACDALRRGLNHMCHILQYYVSPVNYVSDSEDCFTIRSKKLKKKKLVPQKTRKSSRYKINSSFHTSKKVPKWFERQRYRHADRSESDSCWRRHTKYSLANKMERNNKSRQPRRPGRYKMKQSFPPTLWPEELNSDSSEAGGSLAYFENPMRKLVQYLDDFLKADIQDFT